MEKIISDFLKLNNITIDNVVITGVSGGADSVCLLSVLHNLGYKVVLAHVNHHKRKESEEEALAMEELAKRLNIPFELFNYYYAGNDNFHNDSHNARYKFFKELCNKYNTNIITTAHHKDDQIETVLMKLMEGSNLYGYGGIAIEYIEDNYRIIRPLLSVDKEEIYKYVKDNNLPSFEDKSNEEDDFLRNRIRHHVVPLLKAECNDLGTKIMEYSIQAHEAFDYIRNESISYLNERNNIIDIISFNKLNIALKKDILALLLERYNIRKNNDIINSLLSITLDNVGNKEIHLENNYRFLRSYNKASIIKENTIKNEAVYLNENEVVEFGNLRFYLTNSHNNNLVKYITLCYNNLVFPLCIRYKEDGDTISLGIGTKKVSRVLIDNKVPKDKRSTVPVIVNGNGEILCVYNYAKSESVVASKENGDIKLICEVIEK